ncbi:MAG: hypothetical protein CR988_06825 [Treponema sp.]|nr:MAG: hypothetical protein CR988_06825 [Treponema sp.]
MKKKIIAIALILILCTAGAFAIGVGFQIDAVGYTAFGGNAGITIKLDKPDIVFLIMFGGYLGHFNLTLAVDYWFLNDKIANIGARDSVNWYIGIGGYGAMGVYRYYYYNSGYTTTKKAYLGGAVGVRLPVGINFFVPRNILIEPYFQLAPYVGLGIYPNAWSEYTDKRVFVDWGVPLSFGCRFWFK